ncbi:MAG: hypothetical protein HQ553_06300 [Chloroflexi bacterium]|nr:hypothetical protein [Chloroflexota bacterium]
MANIRCTKKLLNELKIKPTDELGQPDGIGNWHANLLWIDRRKCVLFTNDKTLFSFLVTGMKKPQFVNFYEVFRLNLFKNLMNEDLPQRQIEHVFNEHREIRIAKTNNRSVLGSMNDLAYQLECRIYDRGGLVTVDMAETNRELNRIPMGALGYKFSIAKLHEALNQAI